MQCRKNWKYMGSTERQAFVSAVLALKNTVPSVLFPSDPSMRRYDDYVELHRLAMSFAPSWGHGAPAFCTWHRELLRHFEADLQSVDPTVTVPYWDWVTDNGFGSPIWDAAHLGTNGQGTTRRVQDGAFASSTGNWTIRVKDFGTDPSYLTRDFAGDPTAPSLPTAADQTTTLGWTAYDLSPWDDAARPDPAVNIAPWRAFRIFLELVLHNLVHRWVGGAMGRASSPNDPIFWLHHCNIDRLWSVWQRQHPSSDPYVPTSGAPDGHNEPDPLIFKDPTNPAALDPWPGSTASAALLNHQTMPRGHWYDTDPPRVVLETPSVAFDDIPSGVGGASVTTYRAVVFDVTPGPCNPVSFEVTAGPSAGFGTPLGTTLVISPISSDTPLKARLWLSYATSAGTVVGSVAVRGRALDPGGNVVWTQDFAINLAANTVPRRRSAVALVLDRSGSMIQDAGDGLRKVDKLREAVSVFVDLMQDGDGLSVVRFDHLVDRLMSVTDVGPAPAVAGSGRAQAQTIVAGPDLDPRGATSIGGGVEEGKQALDDAAGAVPPYDVRAMLVLTDGNENTPPMIASAASDLTANTFAIGFGLAGNVSAAALNALTLGTGGYLLVTGALGPSDTFRLTKYFLQIQAGISNADVVLDPQGLLAVGTKHRISFPVTEADHGLEVILLSAAPQLIDYALETPDGQVIDPARAGAEPSVAFVSAAKTSYYRMGLPALAGRRLGSHAGQWHAVLSLGRRTKAEGLAAAEVRKGALPYALLVHCYSTLRMKALLQQSRFVPPADLLITARLTEYDAPVEHRATVWAEVTWPNDSSATVRLREAEPGNYRGDVRAEMPGVYRVRVRATGATFAGRPFQRESTLTAALFLGSSGSGTSNGGGLSDLDDQHARLCKLLSCVLEKAAAGDKVRALLADWGIDRERLQACLKEYCEPRGARVMAETRRKPLSEEGKAPKEKITFLEEPKAEPRRRTEFTKQMHRHPFPLLSELAGKQPGVSTHEHDPAKGPAEHAQGKSAKEGRSKKRGKRRSS